VNASDLHTDNGVSSSSITYRELTKRELDAYSDALYRIRKNNYLNTLNHSLTSYLCHSHEVIIYYS
jgi:hypothetical protein